MSKADTDIQGSLAKLQKHDWDVYMAAPNLLATFGHGTPNQSYQVFFDGPLSWIAKGVIKEWARLEALKRGHHLKVKPNDYKGGFTVTMEKIGGEKGFHVRHRKDELEAVLSSCVSLAEKPEMYKGRR